MWQQRGAGGGVGDGLLPARYSLCMSGMDPGHMILCCPALPCHQGSWEPWVHVCVCMCVRSCVCMHGWGGCICVSVYVCMWGQGVCVHASVEVGGYVCMCAGSSPSLSLSWTPLTITVVTL